MIPISIARLSNQIIFVCAFLTNFLPAPVPLAKNSKENDVDDYFKTLSGSEIETDLDSDSSTD